MKNINVLKMQYKKHLQNIYLDPPGRCLTTSARWIIIKKVLVKLGQLPTYENRRSLV